MEFFVILGNFSRSYFLIQMTKSVSIQMQILKPFFSMLHCVIILVPYHKHHGSVSFLRYFFFLEIFFSFINGTHPTPEREI